MSKNQYFKQLNNLYLIHLERDQHPCPTEHDKRAIWRGIHGPGVYRQRSLLVPLLLKHHTITADQDRIRRIDRYRSPKMELCQINLVCTIVHHPKSIPISFQCMRRNNGAAGLTMMDNVLGQS